MCKRNGGVEDGYLHTVEGGFDKGEKDMKQSTCMWKVEEREMRGREKHE